MTRIRYLVQKELLQTRRDRLALLFILILPVAFTVFFGLLFGDSSDLTSFPVAVADQDGGRVANELLAVLDESGVVEFEAMEQPAAEKAVDEDEVAAALIVPSGFSAAVDEGRPIRLTLVRSLLSTGAQSVEEAVNQAAARLTGERVAARIAVSRVAALSGVEQAPDASERALALTAGGFSSPAISVTTENSGSREGEITSGFNQSSPGMVINWILIGLIGASATLVLERRTGVIKRLLTVGVGRPQIIIGKGLGMLVISFIQQLLLIGLGQLVFGVDYFRSPVSLVLLMISLSVFAASLGLLLATVFRSEAAVVAASVILSMLLAAMGGAWFPLEVTSSGFSAVAHFLPTTWIVDSLHGIILRGWGITRVLPALGMAWGFAIVFFGISVWRFRTD